MPHITSRKVRDKLEFVGVMTVKRIISLLMCMLLLVSITGCGTKTDDIKSEEMPADYGWAVTVAQNEFNRTFSDFPNLEITETSTMARTTSTESVVIQLRYSSDNGNGIYGFEIKKQLLVHMTLFNKAKM